MICSSPPSPQNVPLPIANKQKTEVGVTVEATSKAKVIEDGPVSNTNLLNNKYSRRTQSSISSLHLIVPRMRTRPCRRPAVTHSRAVGIPVGQTMSWCCCRPTNDTRKRAGHAALQTVTQMTVEMKQPEGKTQEPDLPQPPLAQHLVLSQRVSVRTDSFV